MMSYYLDPDYRRDAPAHGLYCCRCQKALRDNNYITVTVDYNTMTVRKDANGKEYIGNNCWKIISNKNGN
jgi:hypothetical protein